MSLLQRNSNPKAQTQEEMPFLRECDLCANRPRDCQKILATEQRAQVIDWLALLESYGITKREFLSEKERLAKKFRTEPADRDVIWASFNNLVLQHARISDFSTQQTIYRNMARFVEEEGKDPFHLLQQASRMELMELKQSGCTKVKTSTCNDNDVCPSCRNLERQVFKIHDALEVMPLPNKECTTDLEYRSRGHCRCCYVPSA